MEIRIADNKDLERIKEIWNLCFGDELSYIDLFFDNLFDKIKIIIALADNNIVSMLSIIPTEMGIIENDLDCETEKGILENPFNCQQNFIKTAMIYGVATHPDYQGRGYSSKLLDYASLYLEKTGFEYSFLLPANDRLYTFYEKLGYQNFFYNTQICIDLGNPKSCELQKNFINPKFSMLNLEDSTPVLYNEFRKKYLKNICAIHYSDEIIKYQQLLCKYSGLNIYNIYDKCLDKTSTENNICENLVGIMAVEKINDNEAIIKEILGEEIDFISVAQLLYRFIGCKKYYFRTVFKDENIVNKSKFGLIRKTGKPNKEVKIINKNSKHIKSGYIGLAFD